MAPSSSAYPSSGSKSPLPPPHQSRHFTPIQECDREEQEEEDEYYTEGRSETAADKREYHTRITNSNVTVSSKSTPSSKYHPTPLHEKKKKPNTPPRPDDADQKENTNWVSCNKCRPNAREKISVVPLDNTSNNDGLNKHSSFSNIPSPNALFKSIFSSLTKKSPKSPATVIDPREGQWKVAVAEISHKLVQATRTRDEAILEASRLKNSLSELEKKLNKLEVYCHNLKSGFDECSSSSNANYKGKTREEINNGFMGVIGEKVIEQFLVCVSEARFNVRLLSRTLTMQLRHGGGKVLERLSLLLQPYDMQITSISKNPKSVIVYLEALLNRAFFEDFESIGFQKSSVSQTLNPIDRCEANYASFNVLKELSWEEVLTKGTRHFSEEFSKFCDRKMSEIVAMLGWNRAWHEPLLQAFFGASKSVWLVHLLANSLHPGLPIFRVDKWVGFDPVYMEDMGIGGGDHHHRVAARKLVPTMVRIMVAPGFYVYGNVVKCKVLCRYCNNGFLISSDKGLTPSP